MLQINQNIKKYRELCGKSQQQMADLLGIKRTTYANWETNTEPELTKIMDLAKIFGVHYTAIIEGEKENHHLKEETTRYVALSSTDKHKDEIIDLLKKHNDQIYQLSMSKDAIVAAIDEVKTNLNDAADKQQTFRVMTVSGQQVALETLAELRGLNKHELVHRARSIGDALLHDTDETYNSDSSNNLNK